MRWWSWLLVICAAAFIGSGIYTWVFDLNVVAGLPLVVLGCLVFNAAQYLEATRPETAATKGAKG